MMPAEITSADSFGQAITATIRAYAFESVLEVGSFDGLGSTQVFLEALRHASDPTLVCLEADPARYRQLLVNTAQQPWVRCVCQSSISLASLTPQNFDQDVWESPYNALRYPRELVHGWWVAGQTFLEGVHAGYLESLNETFDVALIDGDEFCGYDDYRLVKDRVRCLMLDDAFHAFKCRRAHCELADDPAWSLVWADANVRNGAAIWVRD
jgi:predicted O-methyltransferase YrrM